MAIATSRWSALALITGHVAGMIDLAALPIWVDTLVKGYDYGPAMAGALPTVFLTGAVLASIALSRGVARGTGRILAPLGFWIACAAFFAIPHVSGFGPHLALHLVGGVAAGSALSKIHGAMGVSAHPHRIFAYAGIGFGLFSLVFLGGAPQLVHAIGPQGFFYATGGAMLIAALANTLWMPKETETLEASKPRQPLPRAVRLAIVGIMGMALVQAMVFSFLVQAGGSKGFSSGYIELTLIALGVVNLFPPALAAVLETRLTALTVARAGALVQGVFALSIMTSSIFAAFAAPAIVFAAVMIFTHTFVFGFIAKHEPTGRAVATTPAMLMTGSAAAPFIGGGLVEAFGYPAIGVAGLGVALISACFFVLADRAKIGLAINLGASASSDPAP
jgi:predicted MFS family arabinose efflux permease